MDNSDLTQLIRNFKEEALDSLNASLDLIDELTSSTHNEESVNELFRMMHSLKGNASLLGFAAIKHLCHSCESILSIYRDDITQCTSEGIGLIKEALSFMKDTILLFSEQETFIDQAGAMLLRDKIMHYVQGAADKDQSQMWDELMEEICSFNKIIANNDEDFQKSWNGVLKKIDAILQNLIQNHIVENPAKELTERLHNPQDLLINILSHDCEEFSEKQMQEVRRQLTQLEEVADADTRILVQEAIASYSEMVPIDGLTSFVAEILLNKIKQVNIQSTATAADSIDLVNRQTVSAKPSRIQSIRVDEQNMDNLLNLISELVISNEVYSHIYKRLEISANGNNDLLSFKKNNEVLSTITSRIQQELSDIRKISLKRLSLKAKQIIAEITKNQNKKIKLIIHNEDLFIDKNLFDTIQDPFIHLICNAADHGIEESHIRTASAKTEVGKIAITFQENEDNFYLTIEDDGKGIDSEAIVSKAIAKGLITQEVALTLSHQQKLHLLTWSGFSTIDNATEYSGRGVGLDIVKRNIASLNGNLEIKSEYLQHTRIQISLPKNVFIKIINGFLVVSAGVNCILSMASVGESFEVAPEQIIQMPTGEECLNRHNKVYAVRRLEDILNVRPAVSVFSKKVGVVIQNSNCEHVILVDEVLGTQQVVAKEVRGLNLKASFITSFAILGNEKIAIMLDVEEIFKKTGEYAYVQ